MRSLSTLIDDGSKKEKSADTMGDNLSGISGSCGPWDEAFFALVEDLLVQKIK